MTSHIEEYRKIFLQDGLGRVEDRLAILEAFLDARAHVTAHEVADRLRERGRPLAEDYVRSVLRLFCNYGLAVKREFQGRDTTYEHVHLGEHHDHLLCVRCGAIQEFADPRLERDQHDIARRYGFRALRHRLEIYGLCSKCAAPARHAFPLAMATPGERAIVTELRGGPGVQRRLQDMGIRIGSQLTVINAGQPGPFIVAVNDSRLALGKGLAHHVLIAPQPEEDAPA